MMCLKDGVRKVVCDKAVGKVMCDNDVRETYGVTNVCVKDGVSKMVGDKLCL